MNTIADMKLQNMAPSYRPRQVGALTAIANMKYYVYILESERDNKYYYGVTSSLERRLNRHNCGQVASTKDRRPLRLVGYETFTNKPEALARETYFK